MKKSVGIIPYKVEDGKLLFFVGHPGGNKRNYWAFMKGGMEEGEDEIDTAIREFREETTLDLSANKNDIYYIGQVLQNPSKEVAAYGIEVKDINPTECKSNLCEFGWPEIDRYRWMTWDVLEPVTHKTHKVFYEKIIHKFNER